jgi:hypothetical protein
VDHCSQQASNADCSPVNITDQCNAKTPPNSAKIIPLHQQIVLNRNNIYHPHSGVNPMLIRPEIITVAILLLVMILLLRTIRNRNRSKQSIDNHRLKTIQKNKRVRHRVVKRH